MVCIFRKQAITGKLCEKAVRWALVSAVAIYLTLCCLFMPQPLWAQSDDGSPGIQPAKSGAGIPVPSEWTPQTAHTLIRMYNPGYNGNGQFRIQDNRVTAAQLQQTGVSDLTPLGAMALTALDLRGLPVTDLSPLGGQLLNELYLENTPIEDLGPLAGMPLFRLYLNNTPVTDLSPLKAMPLHALNLFGTRLKDISALKGIPLEYLWLNETQVSDIATLAESPLVSLTLHRTSVADLRPLAGSRLQRLHIGETPVTDLSPLKDLQLTRLIFTPARISKGIEIVREMASLREIGPSFEHRMPPGEFWRRFDQGEFNH